MANGKNNDWDAPTYDVISDPQARWGAVVLDRLDLAGDEIVLDAGCGSGRVTELLVERLPQGRVVAWDASAAMLNSARARLSDYGDRVVYFEGDLLDLSPARLGGLAPLDAVFSNATFHWITDHDRLFGAIASVLSPSGQLVAQCGGEGNLAQLIEIVRRLGRERAGTWCYASPQQTQRRLEAAGFVGVNTWTHDEPTRFDDPHALLAFLETVCLHEHVAPMTPPERREFLELVIAQMDEPVIDYVRLNITARRGP